MNLMLWFCHGAMESTLTWKVEGIVQVDMNGSHVGEGCRKCHEDSADGKMNPFSGQHQRPFQSGRLKRLVQPRRGTWPSQHPGPATGY